MTECWSTDGDGNGADDAGDIVDEPVDDNDDSELELWKKEVAVEADDDVCCVTCG